MISAGIESQILIARSVLPEAVGPRIKAIGFLLFLIKFIELLR
jgi:hypothetical protein